ncbi:MAG: hypothetical protein JW867_08305 [Candidatus Omnitrophica bacterium]|nr:hypothetical protein [Candidatus Omnitrophota bacterium]
MPKTGQVKNVAIVVPVHISKLSEDEKISLKHLNRYLGHYDRYLVMPDKVEFALEGFKTIKFPKNMYGKYKMYNKRLLSKRFFQSFLSYEYILIYHLDCLVFSDQLLFWCNKGYDYIGAPWPVNWIHLLGPLGRYTLIDYEAVGNGGFSLRKVKSALLVLEAYHRPLNLLKLNLLMFIRLVIRLIKSLKLALSYLFSSKSLKNKTEKGTSFLKTIFEIENYSYSRNEDVFWSFEAKKFYPDFKIAKPEEAISFSFETRPRDYFKRNNNKLPFGCHGWTKFDRDFWQEFLLM